MKNQNYLLDTDFLRQLTLQKNQEVYGKIILLTLDELPISEVQGRITGGTINIDGNSAVRRTCSLTMVSDKVDVNNSYWALKNKFKLEIGLKNTINARYPDIVWFKQGIYIFTSLSTSVQMGNFTISLSGKDKMCQLNGEVGGNICTSTDFGTIEEYETLQNGEIIKNKIRLPIKDIITNMIHLYAHESIDNVILNDIDNYGLELLEYRGTKPVYLIRHKTSGEIINITINGNQSYYRTENLDENNKIAVSDNSIIYYTNINTNSIPTLVYGKDKNNEPIEYNIIKIEKNQTFGYRKTDLTYPGDLVANVGESIVTVLDKIKNIFTDFEYFYDVDGRFIFQKKQTYINNSWNSIFANEKQVYVENSTYTSPYAFSFQDGILQTAISNSPQILNIKNDFSIWGVRKGVGGQELPIHIRYAINEKPVYYFPIRFEYKEMTEKDWEKQIYEPNKYYIRQDDNYVLAKETQKQSDIIYYQQTDEQIVKERTDEDLFKGDIVKAFVASENFDWRELIYQMALDYFKYNHTKNNFTQLIAAANPEHYPTGITGYETYYTDMQSFWRQLYFPGVKEGYEYLISESEKKQAAREILIKAKEEVTEEKIKDIELSDIIEHYKIEYNDNGYHKYIETNPELLNFDFNFLNTNGELNKYSVKTIGDRTKAVNDNKITAIYFQETPSVLILTSEEFQKLQSDQESLQNLSGYSFVNLPDWLENYFTISAQGKSAQDELYSLLNQHISLTESITLTTIPIYHLQPNMRILVQDYNMGLNGEYILNRISIPLSTAGTGSISATKVIDKIY